jgi:hypothetical protein
MNYVCGPRDTCIDLSYAFKLPGFLLHSSVEKGKNVTNEYVHIYSADFLIYYIAANDNLTKLHVSRSTGFYMFILHV